MASIQLRNVPDDLYDEIARMAREEHRTIPQQTLALLKSRISSHDEAMRRRKAAINRIKETKLPNMDPDWIVAEIRKDRETR